MKKKLSPKVITELKIQQQKKLQHDVGESFSFSGKLFYGIAGVDVLFFNETKSTAT